MKVVLFCGGQGMRLRDYSDKIPKPMVPVGNRPILWHVMKYYAQYGHTDFILALGYKSEAIKEYFLNYEEAISNDFILKSGGREKHLLTTDIDDWTITFVDTGIMSEVGERLWRVRRHLEDEEMFFVNYTDGVTDLDLADYLQRFQASGKAGAMTLVRPPHSYHVVNVVDGEPKTITPMGETGQWINGGYFILTQRIFDYLEQEIDMLGAIELMMSEGEIFANTYEGFWRPMDTFKDKQHLDSVFESGAIPWLIDKNGY